MATSLTKFAASMRDPDPDGAQKVARQAWRERGILVIFPGQLNGMDREFARALGDRIWGKSK